MIEALRNTLIEFTKAVSKIHLIGTISDEIFSDFPKNLPEIIRDKWKEKMKNVIYRRDTNELEFDFNEFGVLGSLIHVLPLEGQTVDFKQIILRQDIINYIAHLEAVMQDIQRFIFINKPELLPDEKQLSYKEIISIKTMPEMLDYMINKQLEKSGYDKLSAQVTRLNNKPYLFKISIKKEELQKIDLLVSIRNLILHNGSKITNEYLVLNPSSTLRFGESLHLTRQEINDAHILIQRIAYETYASVGDSLFGIGKTTLYDEMSYNPER